jgi:voltage-gated potassium channel
MGAVLYVVSAGTAFLLEGQLGHGFQRRKMERQLADLNDHMIVCGSGRTALCSAAEMVAVQRAVVLIVSSKEAAERVAHELPPAYVVLGDATDDDVLRAAGVDRAGGLVACTDSDNENVGITLSARQLNPGMRIVARLEDVEQEPEIRRVGANAVVSPQHIGGLRLASELVRPTVVTFLDQMLRDRETNLRIDEVSIDEGAPAVGMTVGEVDLEDFRSCFSWPRAGLPANGPTSRRPTTQSASGWPSYSSVPRKTPGR